MVVGCRDAVGLQKFSHFPCPFAVAGIGDGRPRKAVQNMEQFGRLVFRIADNVGQVFPFEAHAEDIPLGESQPLLDIFYHFGCSCGRQCQNGYTRQQLAYFGNLQVGRTEVISPLRDAVCLVDGDEIDLHVAQFGPENIRGEPFWRDVQELVVPEDAVLQGHYDFFPGHPGIDRGGLDAARTQLAYLVLHQGDERSDH